MTKYREILRLWNLGLKKKEIAESCGCSRNTVATVLQRMESSGLTYPLAEEMTDKKLSEGLFPSQSKPSYKMPDYGYVHREMAKSGVTLTLLWLEYCDRCRESGEIPYQSTQFHKYYADYIKSTKATMHINRKPGELMEVDWAGQTAEIIDTDTGEIINVNVFVATLPYSGYSYMSVIL
jgi:transposase